MKCEDEDMKRRIATLLTLTISTTMLLSGCGSIESKQDTMTVSEMLETVLKDNGGEVYIYEGDTDHGAVLGKDMDVDVYAYDGEEITMCEDERFFAGEIPFSDCYYDLGDIANDKINFEKNEKKGFKSKVLGLNLETDDTGNDVYIEAIKTDHESDEYFFGTFRRIEVYDATFMCFETRVEPQNGTSPYTVYTVIKDTESTKDKTIVWDEVGTEGILVDEMGINPSIYFPPKPAD